jgi:hypothetical protein
MPIQAVAGTMRLMDGSAIDFTAWAAVGGSAWAMVRAGVAKKMLNLKEPERCAACGRQKRFGRCPCTVSPSRDS